MAVAIDAAEATRRGRHRGPRRQPARRGTVSLDRTGRTATSCFLAGVPVLSVEAATTLGWERFADESIGIDRFGASAPGDIVLDKLGINVDHVVDAGTGTLRYAVVA